MVAYALTADHTSVPVFVEKVFEDLPRTDQRRWAEVYLRGLLTTPGKKSVRRLAAAASSAPAVSQSLHQFVNASPWDWSPVRAELTRWVEQEMAPQAWVVGQAVLRKRGEHSCGVHRRFLASTGRSVTCQIGVGMFLSSDDQAVPVDWRLLLPGSWAKDPERRARTRIPTGVGPRSVEQHALDLVDTLTDTSLNAPLPVVADLEALGGTSATALVHGLALRGHDFAVVVPDSLKVAAGRHLRVQRSPGNDGQGLMIAARRLFDFEAGALTQVETVAPRDGRGRPTTVMSAFVRLPAAEQGGERIHRTYQLLAVRPHDARQPLRLWLTSLTQARTETILALTRTLAHAGDSVKEMSDDFGLQDFEGRSYPGWHHHMTMVSAAHAYSRFHGQAIPTGGGERLLVAA
ncbi:IS701 family transposase [Streptomyces sp. SID2131]|nr:IS701 family transposase [Streptomyces sp. SID2131]